MPIDLTAYAQSYPLSPVGGMFVAAIGLGIVVGGIFGRIVPGLIAGFALAIVGTSLFAAMFSRGLPIPTATAVGSLIVAIIVEAVAIGYARRLRAARDGLLLVILAIVAGHFFLMWPAFGIGFVVLGVLGLANVAGVGLVARVPLRAVWTIDGLLKVLIGGLLWSGSPYFHP